MRRRKAGMKKGAEGTLERGLNENGVGGKGNTGGWGNKMAREMQPSSPPFFFVLEGLGLPRHGAGIVFSSLSFLHWRQVLEDSSTLKGWKIHSSRQNEVLTSILKGMKGQLNRHLGHWTVLSVKRWEEQCRNTQRLPQGLRAGILSTSQAPNPLTRLENIPWGHFAPTLAWSFQGKRQILWLRAKLEWAVKPKHFNCSIPQETEKFLMPTCPWSLWFRLSPLNGIFTFHRSWLPPGPRGS